VYEEISKHKTLKQAYYRITILFAVIYGHETSFLKGRKVDIGDKLILNIFEDAQRW
jgi:hypothetical protein